MKRYLSIYLVLVKLNFHALLAYRGNFINNFLSSLSWGFFSLYSIVLLTSRTHGIFGWKREEILLLNGIYGTIIGFYHVFFSTNFDRFSQVIHMGQLDMVLTKPLDSQFFLTFWRVNFAASSRILIAFVYTILVARQLHISPSPMTVLFCVLLAIVGLVLLYSIWFTVITLILWFTRLSNLADLLFTITGAARYPQEMFREGFWYFFVFIAPLTLIITTPAKVLFQKLDMTSLFLLIVLALVFFVISRKFWKFALRSYTSASS